jgi:predicted Zn-dependent peptidase
MHGMAGDAGALLRMLGDIVLEPSFPAVELERERQVLLHECTEDEEDPMSTAFKLFYKACFGLHPVAQSVIGPRRNIERLGRDDLMTYVQRQYSAGNLVVGAAGLVDPESFAREAEAVFGVLPASAANRVAAPVYRGGVATRRLAGNSQAHAVLGFAIPSLAEEEPAFTVAAAVFGEGMSSPLMDQIREQRGLAYYVACSADVFELCGQFVVEASTAPGQLDELLASVMRLLREHTADVKAVDLERAHRQLAVRRLRAHERPYRRLEDAALDLLGRGALRTRDEWLAGIHAVGAAEVSAAFARMLQTGASVALAGALPRAAGDRAREILATPL